MNEETFQFVIQGVVRRAVDKTGVGIPDAAQERIVASIMEDAEWQARVRAVWGNPGEMTSAPIAPDAAQR